MVEFLRGVGRRCGLVVAVSGLLLVATARAVEVPEFPADPAQWINSGPLSASGLKGKGIVLWFFEEECPRCRARWPALIESAKKFEGQPVGNGLPGEWYRRLITEWKQIVGLDFVAQAQSYAPRVAAWEERERLQN